MFKSIRTYKINKNNAHLKIPACIKLIKVNAFLKV